MTKAQFALDEFWFIYRSKGSLLDWAIGCRRKPNTVEKSSYLGEVITFTDGSRLLIPKRGIPEVI